MRIERRIALAAAICAMALAANANTRLYVARNGSDAHSGLSWANAFATIQAAVDASESGDEIIVGDGVYPPFEVNSLADIAEICVVWGFSDTSPSQALGTWYAWDPGMEDMWRRMEDAWRNSRAKSISITSLSGAENTVIDGGGTNICATLSATTNVLMRGFTIRNGLCDVDYQYLAGGVVGGIVEDCVIAGNVSTPDNEHGAGGVVAGAYSRCVFMGNSGWCGAVSEARSLENCLLYGNTGGMDGIVANTPSEFNDEEKGAFVSCTIAGNECTEGVVVARCTLGDCIVWGNSSPGHVEPSMEYCFAESCCLRESMDGQGNFVANPLFIDAANGDFHLRSDSPCINAGSNEMTTATCDLDGQTRIIFGRIDVGCYESSAVPPPHKNPVTRFVSQTGSDAHSGLSWADAFATIQAAVDASESGDEIIVGDGVYPPFEVNGIYNLGYVAFWWMFGDAYPTPDTLAWLPELEDIWLDSRTKALSIRSVNGAGKTVIDGGGTNICAALSATTNVVLRGFTIRNGLCDVSSGNQYLAGGVVGGIVEDCIVSGNIAAIPGCSECDMGVGGAVGGVYRRCIFRGNSGAEASAISLAPLIDNCLICENDSTSSFQASTVKNSAMSSCTVAGNTVDSPSEYGSVVHDCSLANCIVWGNSLGGGAYAARNCDCIAGCLQGPIEPPSDFDSHEYVGIIDCDPQFTDPGNGDYRLRFTSPCINAGSNGLSNAICDIDGNPRIFRGRIDLGCHEATDASLSIEEIVPYSWLIEKGVVAPTANESECETAMLRFAANGVNRVWECYITGVDPTNPDDRFLACIDVDANGNPIVTWKPNLDGRIYTVLGKEKLGDAWLPALPKHHFFKVKVSLKH